MKLHNKIIVGFFFIITLLILANLFSTTYILENTQKERLKTAEVFLAKDLSASFLRDVVNNRNDKLTDVLFEEKKLREEKIEYILVFDEKGYLLSHTYLSNMPKQLLKLNNSFGLGEDYKLEKIENDELFVYDIAVPMFEGIKQVGTVHLGVKGSYIKNIIKTTSNSLYALSIVITLVIGLIGVFISFFISRSISGSIRKLTEVSDELSKGNLGVRADVSSKDEVGRLGLTFNQMASKIQEAHRDLEKKIEQRTKELTQTNKKLIQAEKVKSNFLNIVSHELKTPLTAIMAYLDILESSEKSLDEEQIKSLDTIRRNSKLLSSLIGNILEVARMEAGKFELINVEVDVKKKLDDIVDNLKILAHNKGIELVLDPSGLPEKMTTDEQRLEEIFNNLISNAVKFTEKGGVYVSANVEGNFLSVRVKDTGVGIPKDHINKLFTDFYQVDASISRRYGGTGLGLSITKKLVELQGGEIKLESEVGKGSVFSFTLPLKPIENAKKSLKKEGVGKQLIKEEEGVLEEAHIKTVEAKKDAKKAEVKKL